MRILMKRKGQAILEYTFCLVIILLLFYGCVMVFRWAGVNLADRRILHDQGLQAGIDENWRKFEDGPLKQLAPGSFNMSSMNLVFNGWKEGDY